MILTDLETIQWLLLTGGCVVAFGLGVIAAGQR